MQCSPGPHQTVKGNGIKENRLRGKILCPHIVNAAAVPFICKGNRQRVRNPKTLKIYFQSLFFEKKITWKNSFYVTYGITLKTQLQETRRKITVGMH